MNMTNRCDNVNVAWQFELTKPMKAGESLKKHLNGEDPHKEFLEKYDPIKLSKKYEHTKIKMFVIYVILLILGIIFII